MKDNTVVVAAVGDSLGRKRECDDGNPFEHVIDIFRNADLRFMNLETVLTEEKTPVAQKWIHIRTEPSAVHFLKALGIDVVNLAHNHIQDYGARGFNDTLDRLTKAGISPIGAGNTPDSVAQPAILYRNGLKIAFVGFYMYDKSEPSKGIFIADITNPDETIALIRGLRKTCDVLIVSLHWGDEHMLHPSPEQIEFAHRLVDNGAHLIIGHHSHCVQGVERYKNGLIAYSLGNFNFWQWDVTTKWFNRLSVILRVELTDNGVSSYELLPMWIDESYSPVPTLDEEIRKRALDHFHQLSRDIVDGSISWKGWYEDLGWAYISQTLKSFMITIRKYGLSRFGRMLRWMIRKHTMRAIAGAVRATLGGRKPYQYCVTPIELDSDGVLLSS